MAITMTIGAVSKTPVAGTLDVLMNINGRSSATFRIWSADGSYTPDLAYDVVINDAAGVLFAGYVVSIQRTFPNFGIGTFVELECASYSAYADRRVLKASTPGGVPATDAADFIVDNYLSIYGVTRDPFMEEGVVPEVAFDWVKVSEVCDRLLELVTGSESGWYWTIDENKVLKSFEPSTVKYPCPFSIETADPNIIGDVKITKLYSDYANRIILSYNDGTDTPATVTAENSSAISAHGLWEAATSNPNEITEAAAQALADAMVAATSRIPTELECRTMTPGARDGQTVTVALANRYSADFLIQEVRAQDQDGKNVIYTIKGVEGAGRKDTWKRTYRAWLSNAVASGGGIGSVTIPPETSGTIIKLIDFEDTEMPAVDYLGTTSNLFATNANGEGLNGTTYGMLANDDYPEDGFDLGSPGFGAQRSGWVDFYADFSNLQEFGWTLVALTSSDSPGNGNYSASNMALFDLYVGTDSGSRYFWFNTGTTGQVQSSANLFAASTEQLIRVAWTQATYDLDGVVVADGTCSVYVDDVLVWAITGVPIGRGGFDVAPVEVTRIYCNPGLRLDEIRVGYGAYVPR